MRIVLLTPSFPLPSETFIANLFTRLLARGWDAHIVCERSTPSDLAYFPELNTKEVLGRIHASTVPRSKVVAILAAAATLVRCVLCAPGRTLGYLARGVKRHGIRTVWLLYLDAPLLLLAPRMVHVQFPAQARRRPFLGDLLGCAVAVSFHGADLNYVGLEEEPGYYAGVWDHADAIHFTSGDIRARAMRRGYAPRSQDRVIEPTVDAHAFAPGPRDGRVGPLRILSVGRLHWKKGYEYAIDAVARLRDEGVACVYRIVGDGPFRDAVEQAVRDHGVADTVQLLGSQPSSRVRDEMQDADIFLHAAVSEGFGAGVLEAQAMELPVVTSDADGLPSNVDADVTGFVVSRRDARALATGLTRLAADPALRGSMGRAGRVRAMERFDPARQIEMFEALYTDAIAIRTARS